MSGVKGWVSWCGAATIPHRVPPPAARYDSDVRQYRFDRAAGHPVDAYGSRGLIARAVQHGPARLVVATPLIDPAGAIGRQEAPEDQLLLVVKGGGPAENGEGRRASAEAAEALSWRAVEAHAVGSDAGSPAAVLAGHGLEPDAPRNPLVEG